MLSQDWSSYWTSGINQVEGWVGQGVRAPLERIAAVQERRSIKGSVLEIGVHHGKFFIPLAMIADPETEACVAIDVFDDQEKNIDFSGIGSRTDFQKNIDRFCTGRQVHSITADSLSINVGEKLSLLGKFGGFRLASIDGGHTVEHTVNDFLLVQDLLVGGGVVILDDYYNPHWPGVHEGVCRLFSLGTPKLKPFCVTSNKMFLTDYTHRAVYLRDYEEQFGDHANFKKVTMFGSPVVVF